MTDLWALIAEPLAYDFMQRALGIALLVGVVCAVLSCFLVLKGWSLMGDAVSHAVLPGIVLAFVLKIPLAIGAFAAGLASALATGYLKEMSRVKEDTVMGIVFSGMFGFGLVLFTKVDTDQHLNHILFGNVLGVTSQDLVEAVTIGVIVLVAVLAKRRDLLLYCFDPQHARAIGLDVRLLHYGLLVLLALTIVASLKAVGIILVVAMLVGPGATAFLVAKRFETMLIIAVAVATGASFVGTVLSFHIDGATGPTIVLVQAAVFLAMFAWSQWRSVARRPGLAAQAPASAGGASDGRRSRASRLRPFRKKAAVDVQPVARRDGREGFPGVVEPRRGPAKRWSASARRWAGFDTSPRSSSSRDTRAPHP